MKNPKKMVIYLAFLVLLLFGCASKESSSKATENDVFAVNVSSNQEDAIQESSYENLNEELSDSTLIDEVDSSQEKNTGEDEFQNSVNHLVASVPFQINQKEYYIYTGVIGDSSALLAIWTENNFSTIRCTFVIGEEEKEINVDATMIKENTIGNVLGSTQFAFITNQEQALTGYYLSQEGQLMNMSFTLSSIESRDGGADNRYVVGSNEGVEQLAATIKEAILLKDAETLTNYISFPFNMKVNGQTVTIPTKEVFIKVAPETVFCDVFEDDMKNCFSKFMFSNYLGVRIGSETNNIWIYPDDIAEEEDFTITEINVAN